MCGIVGFSGKIEYKREIVQNMMDLIVHRGPNSAGAYTDADMALGFRRLSIIDLADGSQPMYNEDKSLVLVYNGEIYNFQALREELIAAGHTFVTHCDSEVLLHGYEQYGGRELVKKLRGMFAFVIWDTKEKKLFGARDMFGIKPMYYTTTKDGEFIFASEIKSMLAHPHFERAVNKNALLPYLTFQYSATEETFFAGVYKLLPAHFDAADKQPAGAHVLTEYDPSPESVFDAVIPEYLYGVLYGAVVESYCSEQSARRMAMEAASDNAGEMIENLNLSYNRARQAAITQEITEIVAGSGEVGA